MNSLRFLFVLALLAGVGSVSAAELDWPKINSQTKPWTRWWWLGNIGTEREFTTEMEKYAAAGLGGLEITPIYGVRGEESRFTPYLSPGWSRKLAHVIREGRRLDLGIDMSTGTGWPFGGPWVKEADAAKYLANATYTLNAGERLAEPVRFVQTPLVRVAGPRRVTIDELKEPVASNPNQQDLSLDQVRFAKPLPLVTLMAFSSTGASLDLTKNVGADGRLDWVAPAGTWTLHALFSGWHGKMVERAGPGGEGLAIDHFSSGALATYLKAFETAHSNRQARGLRAYFNDSYEVDDAQGESNWTPRFLEEFQRRRGYDLRTQLPALFATAASGASARVLSDYRETISDLLLEEFTVPWQKWAKRQGSLIRNQAHGSPANILDLYAASDIPEQEGTDVLAIKLASSAAHLTGKPLASSETATWLNEHFLSTLAELRASVDTFFLGGINHNCYHGTAFSPPGEPWPGFQFYASVELSPANPFWNDFAAVNAYVARAQSFLQSGRPDEDVLLYYNIHDRWAERGNGATPHFNGREGNGVGARETGQAILATGLGFDFVSDRLLADIRSAGKMLEAKGARYRAVVVPATKFMPLATLQHLAELADGGATLIFHRHLPESAAGLSAKETDFRAVIAKLQKNAMNEGAIKAATVGKGRVLVGEDLPALLVRAGLRGEPMVGQGLRFVRRTNDRGPFYFIANSSAQPVDGWVTFGAESKAAAIFDPMSGRTGMAAHRPKGADASDVFVQLAPGESRIVQLYTKAPGTAEARWTYWQRAGEPRPLAGTWSVGFKSGGPVLPAATQVEVLKSWTNFAVAGVKEFSGTANYTLTFPRPDSPAVAWQLDLGRVAESARVMLNGRELAVLVQPPFRLTIPADTLQAQNTLVVAVTNLAANRIADLDRRDPSWKKFYNTNMPARRRENADADGLFSAAKWAPLDSGLIGPVTLTPVIGIIPK